MSILITILNNLIFRFFVYLRGETVENVWEQHWYDFDTGWNRCTTLFVRIGKFHLYLETTDPCDLTLDYNFKTFYSAWAESEWTPWGLHLFGLHLQPKEEPVKLSGEDYGWFPYDNVTKPNEFYGWGGTVYMPF